MSRKEVIILRSPSGGGKSTLAKKLLSTVAPDETAVVVSADHYFERTGKYQFNPNELPMAHMSSQKKFEQALQQGTNLVIVDNTNLRKWEYMPYINIAIQYGYSYYQIVLKTKFQNIHGVPDEKVKQMSDRFQEDDTIPVYPGYENQ